MKKYVSMALALLLVLGLTLACPAAEELRTVEELGMTLRVPQGLTAYGQDTPSGDPALAAAGISEEEWYRTLGDMRKNNVYLVLMAEDGFSITVTKKENSNTQDVYSLSLLDDTEIDKLLEELRHPQEGELTGEASRYDGGTVPFLWSSVSGSVQGKQIWETCTVTIVNGFSVTIDMYSEEGAFTEQQQAWLRQVTDSVSFLELKEKPVQEFDAASVFALLIPIALLILIVLLPLAVVSVNKRREKRQRLRLGEKLSEYRRRQLERERQAKEKNEPLEEPKPLFQNRTECSTQAVRRYCDFTILRKQLGIILFYGVLVLLCFAGAVFIQTEWWLRLILVGVGIFLTVRVVNMPGKLFETEEHVYRKAKSRVCLYAFREEDFRVSGIQSSSVYPYFQITAAYETKDFFYLYFGSQRAYLVAKEGFSNGAADMEQFRAHLQKKLGKSLKR